MSEDIVKKKVSRLLQTCGMKSYREHNKMFKRVIDNEMRKDYLIDKLEALEGWTNGSTTTKVNAGIKLRRYYHDDVMNILEGKSHV